MGGRPDLSHILPLLCWWWGQYQITLLGDRGTRVWTTCPKSLPGSAPGWNRTGDLGYQCHVLTLHHQITIVLYLKQYFSCTAKRRTSCSVVYNIWYTIITIHMQTTPKVNQSWSKFGCTMSISPWSTILTWRWGLVLQKSKRFLNPQERSQQSADRFDMSSYRTLD